MQSSKNPLSLLKNPEQQKKKRKINKNKTQQPPKFAIRSKQTELSKRKFQKIKNHQLDNRGKKKIQKNPSQKGERKRGHNTNHKPDDLGYMTPKNARFFFLSLSNRDRKHELRKKCINPGLICSDRLHRGLSSNVCVDTRILLQTARCPDALPSSSSPTFPTSDFHSNINSTPPKTLTLTLISQPLLYWLPK